MNINIEMEIYTQDNDAFSKRANFGVDDFEFEVNPHKEALKVAYQWFDRVRREFPYDIRIKSVKYNREHDITEGLKKVLNKERRIVSQEWKAPWE